MSTSNTPEHPNAGERDERIAAYVDGAMTPGEAAAFEREMAADAPLRRAVEQWCAAIEAGREWAISRPLGVERIEALDARSIVRRGLRAGRPARVIPVRRAVWRVAAAAAVFLAGVYVGQVMQRDTTTSPLDNRAVAPQEQQILGEKPKPIERPETAASPGGRAIAGRPSADYARDENGRLVVETTLKHSGARVTMVIDGRFDLAQASPAP